MRLRDFQIVACANIEREWAAGNRGVVFVAPTGSGKTVCLSEMISRAVARGEKVIAVAHRQELVSQISCTIAKYGIQHRILTRSLEEGIRKAHRDAFGKSFVNPHADVAVVGVKSLIGMSPDDKFIREVRLLVIDEAHHVTESNEWGKAVAMMRDDCKLLLPTATPLRGDKKGLGVGHGGVAHAMVLAPQMRQIIDMGFLLDYEVYCPTVSRLHVEGLAISSTTGDYSQKQLAEEVTRAQIVGDTVQAYLKFGQGAKAVVFNVTVEQAEATAAAFREAGIPAEALSAKTDKATRNGINGRLRSGETRVVCNVDVLGEGYDVSDLRVCILARPTASFGLYTQQFGRVLRLALPEGISMGEYGDLPPDVRKAILAECDKPTGIIIDQVGNVERLGLPDAARTWTLTQSTKGTKKESGGAIPLVHCPKCFRPYEKIDPCCPYCGEPKAMPKARTLPEEVDGDFAKLDPEVLAAMRGDIEKFDAIYESNQFLPRAANARNMRSNQLKHGAQGKLRAAMDLWAGWRKAEGEAVEKTRGRFCYQFGIDMLSAQVLLPEDAEALQGRIEADLAANKVEEA